MMKQSLSNITKENTREFSRSNISIAIRLTPVGKPSIDAMVIDLSLNGILIQSDEKLAIGEKCHISMLLGHHMHELPINAKGIVIRSHDGMIAISFNVIGIESTEEVQDVILFRSDNPGQCLHEFEHSEASGQ